MMPKLVLFFILNLISIQSFATSEHNLTKSFAGKRRAQISKVEYEIKLNFSGDRAFAGNVRIKLSLNETTSDLVLDSKADKIYKIIISGNEIKEYSFSNGMITIPAKYLSKVTLIDIEYSSKIGSASFFWYGDPQDGKKYFYTNLEPYGLNEVFPCFDQPDLKATFELSVKGPKEWTFIANENPKVSKVNGELVEVSFPKTSLISPYLFFIAGGPYVEYSDEFNGLPLKVYARHSLRNTVDAKAIFELTKKGLTFFESYFDYPYPFSKYAHVFAPDFATSGMENPGAIVLNERFILNKNAPENQLLERENLIYHEMAHIWFGDLVTMKWWDDLWLNESFASFMSYLAQTKISNDPKKWIMFEYIKIWARHTDRFPSTHPILFPIPDIISAESSFDGITYGKGASSLKQLYYFAGEETFQKGIRSYFKKFAFKNSELKDFIAAIDKFSPKDLNAWGNKWFQTKGLNRITVDFDCKEGKINRFEVLQNPSVKGNQTPHKTLFGFYLHGQETLKLMKKVSLEYSGLKTHFSKLVGSSCPDFIMPNQDNHDYGLFSLDSKSKIFRKIAMAKLPDPISRLQLWSGLEQDVYDGVIKPTEFFDFTSYALMHETDSTVLAIILGIQKNKINLIKIPFHHYLTPSERKYISLNLEKILFNRMINAENFSDLKLSLFDLYLLFARSSLSQDRLYRFITKGDNIKGIRLSQEVRWDVIQALAYNNHPKSIELIENERRSDSTFQGQVMENVAKASFPRFASKNKLWNQLLNLELPYVVMSKSVEHIHHPDFPKETLNVLKNYFSLMEKMDWDQNKTLVFYYLDELFPHTFCSPDVVAMSSESLRKAKLNLYAKRTWTDNHAKLERCVRLKTKAISLPKNF